MNLGRSNPSLVVITEEERHYALIERQQLSPVAHNTTLAPSLPLTYELDFSQDELNSLFPSRVTTQDIEETPLVLARPRPLRRNRWRRMYERLRRPSHSDVIRRQLILHRLPSSIPLLTTSPLQPPEQVEDSIPRDDIEEEEYYEALSFRFDSSVLSRSTSMSHPMFQEHPEVIIRRGTWHPPQGVRSSRTIAERLTSFFQHPHHSSSPQLTTPTEDPSAPGGDNDVLSLHSEDEYAVENPNSRGEFPVRDNFGPRESGDEEDVQRPPLPPVASQHVVLPSFTRVRRTWSQMRYREGMNRRAVVSEESYEQNHQVLERLKQMTIGSLDTVSTSSTGRDIVRSRRKSFRLATGQAGELYVMMGMFDEYFEDPLKVKSNINICDFFQVDGEPMGPPPTRCSESSFVFEPITLDPIPHIYI